MCLFVRGSTPRYRTLIVRGALAFCPSGEFVERAPLPGELVVSNRKRADILADLRKHGFKPYQQIFAKSGGEDGASRATCSRLAASAFTCVRVALGTRCVSMATAEEVQLSLRQQVRGSAQPSGCLSPFGEGPLKSSRRRPGEASIETDLKRDASGSTASGRGAAGGRTPCRRAGLYRLASRRRPAVAAMGPLAGWRTSGSLWRSHRWDGRGHLGPRVPQLRPQIACVRRSWSAAVRGGGGHGGVRRRAREPMQP